MTVVTRIALADWGSLLGTRGLGADVRGRILTAIAGGPVEVDFSDVQLVPP